MKKKLFLIFTALSLIFTLFVSPPSSQAKEKGEKEKKKEVVVKIEDRFYDENTGKYMNAFKEDENGDLVPMDKEEYQSTMEGTEDPVPETFNSLAFTPDSYTYSPSSTKTLTNPLQKVSASIDCTVKSCTVTKTINATFTNSFTAGLTADATKAIKANAGFTWATSASRTSAYSFTIEKGQRGFIGFNAKYRYTVGTLTSWYEGLVYKKQTVEGRSPKKTSDGELDGTYTFIYE